MPYRAFTSPKKVGDLSSDIRATAYLNKPGLVAKLATDPVRVAILPAEGGMTKTVNVALPGADGVALLSKEVAVVRGTDDSVWSLMDISHRARTEQVARDVRSLAMRPSGQTALVIGWDGNACELYMKREDVATRDFAVRGSIRGCDLTETETYVVVDEGAGGMLRVHPGSTPEAGATARVPLPQGAKALDRVRGGQKLSVVYKPGSKTACVVTGGPANLKAKLVLLEAPPTEMAVHDTSLFVLYADGRAVLYDSDAINAAGDEPMAPKHAQPLNVRGEPRTALLTGKAAPTLWIGTSTGEVVTVTVMRKQQ